MRVRLLGTLVSMCVAMLPVAAYADTGSSTAAPTSTASAQPKILTVGLVNDPDSLNPFVGLLTESYEMYGLMYDTLTGYSLKDYSPTPELATSWKTSADGLTWTYTIRSGVKWSDGVPLTAQDAAYTFNRIINGSAEQTNYGNYVSNIVSAEAPNDTTLILKTKVPTPIMLHLAVPILPEHIWKQIPESQVNSFKNLPSGTPKPVGSGPYILVDRQVGQSVTFEANKNYWGGAPHMDKIVFRIYSGSEALAQALKKGEIEIADNLDANIYNSLKGQTGITTVPAEYSGFNEIGFNTGAALVDGTPIGNGHPALKDPRVRVALAHAIDLKTILAKAMGGYGTVGDSVIPPIYASQHYTPPQPYDFNIAEANKLLDEAGYKRGADGIRRMPDGTNPLKFRFYARSESKASQIEMEYVKEWFAELGIQIEPKTISSDQLTEDVATGNYDLFEWGWVVEPDPDYQLSVFTCDQRSYKDSSGTIQAGLSDSFFCDPAYDALYNKQKTEVDPAQRAQTVKAAEKILYDKAPYIVEYYYNDLEAYRSDMIANVTRQPEPNGSIIFQYGTYTYRDVMTKADYDALHNQQSAGTSSSGGSPVGYVVGGIILVILLAGGVLLMRRSRSTSEDRE